MFYNYVTFRPVTENIHLFRAIRIWVTLFYFLKYCFFFICMLLYFRIQNEMSIGFITGFGAEKWRENERRGLFFLAEPFALFIFPLLLFTLERKRRKMDDAKVLLKRTALECKKCNKPVVTCSPTHTFLRDDFLPTSHHFHFRWTSSLEGWRRQARRQSLRVPEVLIISIRCETV